MVKEDVKHDSDTSAEDKLRQAVKVANPSGSQDVKHEKTKDVAVKDEDSTDNENDKEAVADNDSSEDGNPDKKSKEQDNSSGDNSNDNADDKSDDKSEDKDSKWIPRGRLNQEIEKRKELEKQIQDLQFRFQDFQNNLGEKQTKVKDEVEKQSEAEEMSQELGISLDSALKMINRQEERAKKFFSKEIYELKKDNADIAFKLRIKDALSKHKFASEYEKDITDKLNVMPLELRSDPFVINEAIKGVLGEKVEEIAAKISKSAVKQNEEKKKIIPINNERPSGDRANKKQELSESEKFFASKLKISEEEYLRGKKQ